MKSFIGNKILFVFAGLVAAPAVSTACDKAIQEYYVKDFTNYAPKYGGRNGNCGLQTGRRAARDFDGKRLGKTASGLDACKYFLEDHLSGKAPAVMAAVPRVGGTADLFGGVYRAPSLETALGEKKCIKVIAGDRYDKTENYKSKMDITTRAHTNALTSRVNAAKGKLQLLGRAKINNRAQREIARDLKAIVATTPSAGRIPENVPGVQQAALDPANVPIHAPAPRAPAPAAAPEPVVVKNNVDPVAAANAAAAVAQVAATPEPEPAPAPTAPAPVKVKPAPQRAPASVVITPPPGTALGSANSFQAPKVEMRQTAPEKKKKDIDHADDPPVEEVEI